MTRVFLPPEKLTEEKIFITGDEARYLSLVLRLKPGEQITIFDGTGYRYICRVLQPHKKEVIIEKLKKELYSVESPLSITLAQSLPKAEKMDLIVQKSTELGVEKIIPLITERSQVRRTEKLERWRKIALSASQQCGREKITEIDKPVNFEEFLKNTPQTPPGIGSYRLNKMEHLPLHPLSSREENARRQSQGEIPSPPTIEKEGNGNGRLLRIIFSEEQTERNIKKILTDFKDTKNITLLVGPEGGFSKVEVSAAIKKGFIVASLGPRILRTETAPITAISIIQYELGDIG